ncbi:MAG: phosphoglycerate mutase [Azospirillum sp. 47_25]|nr:MAG: phosphoglycerate mutase [Azospirillum sp. 47_25]
MTTRLIIARHGNTFTKDQTPTRVGGRTDLPLVESERGRNIGKYLKLKDMLPDVVFAAPLKRTMETARLAVAEMGLPLEVQAEDCFREVDYGPDENKPEEEVIARVGEDAIKLWNERAIVPDGWKVDVPALIRTWENWAEKVASAYKDKTVMIVSSNGVIRFAPYITGDFETFAKEHDIKVGTGSVCLFEKEEGAPWRCTGWNIKPAKELENN